MTDSLQYLIEYLKSKNIDAILIPSNNEYGSEITLEYLNRLKFFTGFTGSNGMALIKNDGKIVFFTDGRYIEQAKQELKKLTVTVNNLQNIKLDKWIANYYAEKIIWLCPELYSYNFIIKITKITQIKTLSVNELDSLWINKPKKPKTNIVNYPIKFAGKNSRQKITEVLKNLKKNEAILITDPHLVCWILNIRGSDIPNTPIAICYALIHKDESIVIFTNNHTLKIKKNNIKTIHVINLLNYMQTLYNKIGYILIDFDQTPASIIQIINNIKIKTKTISYINIWQNAIIKTKSEIKLSQNIHIDDSVALIKFLYWIKKSFKNNELTEIKVAEKLNEYRKINTNYKQSSFKTISAFGANSAIIHYNGMNNAQIKNGIYLVDSGGQYYGATTDVTRTIILGKASKKQKIEYTLVLKGLIALSSAIFPAETNAQKLDILARQYLWKHYHDYAHGTSHGVGNYLNVHEPPSISKYGSNFPLKPNMIISNEPGVYFNKFYGIRLENLMYVIKLKNNFLSFEQLTLIPFDYDMINFQILTNEEKIWLNKYNMSIYKKIIEKLDSKEKNFLVYHTMQI